MRGILTIDIGTTSLRAILFDENGRPSPADQRANMPTYHGDGRVEQDPGTWPLLLASLLGNAAGEASRRGLKIVGIALASQRSSVIPVDAAGRALHPAIMWQDVRTAPLVEEMAVHQATVQAITGSRISPVMSAIKMQWLKRERPGIYVRTHRMLGIHDLALHALTGRFVTDPSLASRTNLLDLASRSWDPRLVELFGIDPGLLCELVPPGSVVGGLLEGVASRAGLAPGTPVVTAGGDQQCAALGLGLFEGNRAIGNAGTGSYLLGHSPRPHIDPQARVTCSVAALPGAYVVEAALPTSGTVYRWFRDNLWSGPIPEADPFGPLNAEAEAAGPGAHGTLLLPHFSGSGTPHWNPDSRGLFAGLSLGTTRGDMARAILEGIALDLKGGLDLIEKACGAVKDISVAGGLSQSRLFNQIEADVLGRPILSREGGGEATALGAFMAGAVATGLAPGYPEAFQRATEGRQFDHYEPDPLKAPLYAELRKRALALYDASREERTYP